VTPSASASTSSRTLPRLHLVTDCATLGRPEFVTWASAAMEAGGERVALHLRGPRTTGRAMYETALALGPAARSTGARLLANDRLDVVLAADLDGAHLGARSLPVREARGLMGPERILGASVHDEATLRSVRDDGANHAFVGNLYETASHPGRRGLGTKSLARLIREVPAIPVVAIGGIVPERVGEALGAGAFGVAVLRGVWSAEDPVAAVLDYLAALESPFTEGL
jgi:thiamine-phosphate diphosphorylase